MKKTRETNMDMLRVVSMLLIIFLHSIDHSGVLENAENFGYGMYFYVRFIYAMCMVCVNVYVMLSGYFMVNSKFRLRKLVTLWLETVFYSLGLKLVFMLTGMEDFSIVSLVSCFVPILTGRYWFLTIYIGVYLVSPFVNILIYAMNKKQHGLLNLCLFAIMSVWTSIHPVIAGMNSGGGWGLAWFVVLYLTAAWLRRYYTPDHKPVLWLIAYIGIPLLIAAAQLGLRCLDITFLQTIVNHWFRYDSAPVYVMTICLFVGFMNMQIHSEKISRAIITIAPLTLGVYLIHAHANVSPWIWEILNLPAKMSSPEFLLIQFVSVVGIFVICILIDAIRKATVGRLENTQFIKGLCDQIQGKADTFIQRYFRE